MSVVRPQRAHRCLCVGVFVQQRERVGAHAIKQRRVRLRKCYLRVFEQGAVRGRYHQTLKSPKRLPAQQANVDGVGVNVDGIGVKAD
eukprot:1185242-Prorocentrum_minimum.AAC.1